MTARTARHTPEQRRQNALENIDMAWKALDQIWSEIAGVAGGAPLTEDRVEVALKERCYSGRDYASLLASAYDEYDNAMRKGLRAGLDVHRLGEWIAMGQTFHRSKIFRSLRDVWPDLEYGMQKPLPKEDVALAEVWCNLKHAGKSGGQIFNTIEAMRKRGELKPRKQNSPEAIRKWAKDHHLTELMDIEPDFAQIQPIVEDLVDGGATFNEALEALLLFTENASVVEKLAEANATLDEALGALQPRFRSDNDCPEIGF